MTDYESPVAQGLANLGTEKMAGGYVTLSMDDWQQLVINPVAQSYDDRLLVLQPGDFIMVEVEESVSIEEATNIRDRLKEWFPGYRVAILVSGRMRIMRAPAVSGFAVDASRCVITGLPHVFDDDVYVCKRCGITQ